MRYEHVRIHVENIVGVCGARAQQTRLLVFNECSITTPCPYKRQHAIIIAIIAPVHAHINLVGFSAHCVFGLIYKAWPALKQGALALVQFLLFVIGTPILLIGIAVAIKSANALPAIIGSMLVILGAVVFLVIVTRGLSRNHASP